jgi:hypothetical protein
MEESYYFFVCWTQFSIWEVTKPRGVIIWNVIIESNSSDRTKNFNLYKLSKNIKIISREFKIKTSISFDFLVQVLKLQN